MTLLRRLAAAVLLSGVAVVATATPAFAHAELIGSNPAEDAALATPPQQVELTFNQPVALGEHPVTITGPSGASWTVGTASVAGAVVTAPVRAEGPAGRYALVYEVVSQDGDEVTGSVTFTLTAAAAPPATSATTTSTTTTSATVDAPQATTSVPPAAGDSADDGGVPVWVWVLGGVVVLAAGVAVALRLGRAKGT